MRNKKIFRIVWVSALFLLLIIILVCIMDYKINHEYEEEGYLYFYKCDNKLCTSNVLPSDGEVLSRYECRYEKCPKYEKEVYVNYVLLKDSDNGYELYNYISGDIVSAGYDNYIFINDEYIIVTRNNKDGIINILDDVIVKPQYDKIGIISNNNLTGYRGDYIIALKNSKYGIISYKDGKVMEEFKYSESDLNKLLDIIEKY